MNGPAPALGPDLACRDFLTACAALGGTRNRARALRTELHDPLSESESDEAYAVLEALRTAVLQSSPVAGWACAESQDAILRSPVARHALALFADASRYANSYAKAEAMDSRILAGFPENTPERIARMLEKKRVLERKTLTAFFRKHGDDVARFTEMEVGQRREYLWMWAQSAFLAKRRFVRAAEAWARASVACYTRNSS